jgi:hypothetical protein
VPGFALGALPYPIPRWSAGYDSAQKWLDGVSHALACCLRLPGTKRLRFALLGAQRPQPAGPAAARSPGVCAGPTTSATRSSPSTSSAPPRRPAPDWPCKARRSPSAAERSRSAGTSSISQSADGSAGCSKAEHLHEHRILHCNSVLRNSRGRFSSGGTGVLTLKSTNRPSGTHQNGGYS